MTAITQDWIIDALDVIRTGKLNLSGSISLLEEELAGSEIVQKIAKLKKYLIEEEARELEIKQKWIALLDEAGIEKFESNWIEVRKKVSPWRLVIKDESLIPDQYKEEVVKTTIKIDKKEIKENIKLWEVVEWVLIEQDVSLEIKYL